MGTQQILMVVVSVIVVGAAIFFASQMFDSTATNSQRQQINADLQQFGAKILEYNITPPSSGGGKDCVCSLESLSMFMGFDDEHTFQNYNGIYTIDSFSDQQVQISAMNTEKTIFLKLNVDLSKPSGEAVVVSYGSE
jgi:hypothetical protein